MRQSLVFPLVPLVVICSACVDRTNPTPHVSSQSGQSSKSVPGTQAQSNPASAAAPEQFGFTVVSVEKEFCCSDVPGKLVPTATLAVEGLTDDNWRFVLSCWWTERSIKTKTGFKLKLNTRDEWFFRHTASIKHTEHGDLMTINVLEGEPMEWNKFSECSVVNRIDRAKDVVPIRVISSTFRESKDSSGYEVRARTATELYTLACIEGRQTPCVSVAPATYRAVRDQSELRLAGQDLKVLSTYRIIGEQ